MTLRALGDRGSVTAEFAIALPAVVVVLVLGVGILGSAATAVRLQHETTEAARLLGRGDDAALAAVTARGGTAAVEHREGLVCVSARAPVPVALSLPPVSVRACALDGGEVMAGTVATTGITVVVVVTAASLGVVGSATVEAQRVAGVADAAALAAADAASGAVTGVPCEQAERVASAGGVRLRACDLAGAVATVSVTGAFGSFPVEARSRAGPPRAVADDE